MKSRAAISFLLFFLASAALFGYVVKLKDGSMLFARMKYEVKGAKAIITLENGTVTQIDLAKVDVPGTEDYNRKYSGNVIAIDTPDQKTLNTPVTVPTPAPRLSDLVREKKIHQPGQAPAAPASAEAADSWQTVDPLVQAAFSKVFDGAGIPQWRLAVYRGKTRLLATANTEDAVFNTLSAAARALADLSERGKGITVEITLTTSTNESGGSFEMTSDQARQIVNGMLPVGDYFVRNVIL